MGLPLTVIDAIASLAGWKASGLAAAGRGTLEVRLFRSELKAVGAALPRRVVSWTSLDLVADFAGEVSSAQLVQAAKGALEIRILRDKIKDSSGALQEFYNHLFDLAHQDYLD